MIKKIIVISILCAAAFTVKAQTNPFPNTDSLIRYINRWIRNSPVEAFQNLRMNTALIGIIRFLESGSSGGGGIDTAYAINDSTLRITTDVGLFTITLKGGAGVDTMYRSGDSIRYTIKGRPHALAAAVNQTLQQVINTGNTISENDSINVDPSRSLTIHGGTGSSIILKALQSAVSHTRIVIQPATLGLEYRDLGTGNLKQFILSSANGINVNDGVNTTGMGYGANYRTNGIANFGDRWIPDWGAVRDSIAAASQGTGTAGQLTYWTGTSTIAGDPGALYNALINQITTDSVVVKKVTINGVTADSIPLVINSNYAGYGGVLIRNLNPAANAWLGIKAAGDSLYGLDLYSVYPGAINTSVIKSNSPGGLVIMASSRVDGQPANTFFENHGVSGSDFTGFIHGEARSWIFGPNTDASLAWHDDYRVYVDGRLGVKTALDLCDEGHYYSIIKARNYLDNPNYVEGVGFQFYGITVSDPNRLLMQTDSLGNHMWTNYPNARDDGYTSKALYGDNTYIKYGQVFDNNAGTRNDGALMFWKSSLGVPSSSSSLTWNGTQLSVTGNVRATGWGRFRDEISVEDEGHFYSFIKAKNYLGSGGYVEGVGWKFTTISASNPEVDAFRIDSTGNIKAPVGGMVVNGTSFTADEKLKVNGMTHLTDTVRADARISYSGNYHASFTPFSLVTKKYTDSVVATAGGNVIASYTPTITSVTNVSGTTLKGARYRSDGAYVEVWVYVTIDPTSVGSTEIAVSLPVASEIGANELFGSGSCGVAAQSGIVTTDATNNRATFVFSSTDTGAQDHVLIFTYPIVLP